jgi:hypothetical protein
MADWHKILQLTRRKKTLDVGGGYAHEISLEWDQRTSQDLLAERVAA